MQQFVVPQFIDVEDKIIGPVTVRQFIIVLVGAGLDFVAYKLSDFSLFLFLFVVISVLTFGVAFIKINGRPVHYFILNVLQTSKRPKIRVWQKTFTNSELKRYNKKETLPLPPEIRTKNRVRASRLAEMALIVDTGGVYQGEKEPPSSLQQLV
ncbi:MAG: PrgI family protein [Candidatus Buchananbacteria bacterium]|nr:PrgI family protein [Candidatus Buchananbacteria bacterium]